MATLFSECGGSVHCGGEGAREGELDSIAVQLCFPHWLVANSQATRFLSPTLSFPICKMGVLSSLPLHGALMRG